MREKMVEKLEGELKRLFKAEFEQDEVRWEDKNKLIITAKSKKDSNTEMVVEITLRTYKRVWKENEECWERLLEVE